MELRELQSIQHKFDQGNAKLTLLSDCLLHINDKHEINLVVESIDQKRGELKFWFAGANYYAKVRISDRGIDDIGTSYRVPIGWIDWGRYSHDADPPIQSNFYDERGILCEEEKQEFYCSFEACDDEKTASVLIRTLQMLASRSIAVNNTIST